MKYFLYCLKHYVDFSGRAPRAEFWYFVLFNLIIALVVGGVGYAIGFDKLGSLYSLLVLLPALAVSVRRHRQEWLVHPRGIDSSCRHADLDLLLRARQPAR